MVQQRSKRRVVDNSGVREVRCIQVKRCKKAQGIIGTIVRASVTKVRGGSTWKRGGRVKGLMVMVKKEMRRKDGMWVRFGRNALVRRNKKREPRANRANGIRPIELRRIGYGKLLTISSYVV
jgi:large subunit ribosomal protein L14